MKPFVVSISEYIWLYIMKLLGYTAKTSVSGERHCWNLTKSRNSQFWEGEWGRERALVKEFQKTRFQHCFNTISLVTPLQVCFTSDWLLVILLPFLYPTSRTLSLLPGSDTYAFWAMRDVSKTQTPLALIWRQASPHTHSDWHIIS